MQSKKDQRDKICNFIRFGDTQKVAAEKAGIAESTFYNWMNTDKEFLESVKKAKEDFLQMLPEKLENSLYKKALGYEVEETETEFTSDKDGNPRIKMQRKKKRYVAPDTGALVFALTNLLPKKWANTQKIETNIKTIAEDLQLQDIPEKDRESAGQLVDELQRIKFERLQREKNGN